MRLEPFSSGFSSLYRLQCIWGYFKFKTPGSLNGQSECATYGDNSVSK